MLPGRPQDNFCVTARKYGKHIPAPDFDQGPGFFLTYVKNFRNLRFSTKPEE